jgi:hypothetical protein
MLSISMAAVRLANGLNANMLRKMGERSPTGNCNTAIGEYSNEQAIAYAAGAGLRGVLAAEPTPRADLLPSIHLKG